MKKIKKIMTVLAVFTLVSLTCVYSNVLAMISHGTGDYCFNFSLDEGGFPVSSVTVNGETWDHSDDYEYRTNDKNYTIVIKAGKKGQEFPWISTPGGFDEYGTLTSMPNPDEDPAVENDEYIFTITLGAAAYNGTNEHCSGFGVSIAPGPEPTVPSQRVTGNITIDISGDELEYHYVEDKPNEPDVSPFKFGINDGNSEALVPFTFGNANYTHNDNPAPNNVSRVTTKTPIEYEYDYDGSGYVTFYINASATADYTSIKINGTEYTSQAPHTQAEVFEHYRQGASIFEIENVPYNAEGYSVVVTGENVTDEKLVAGFGWSYLSADRSDIDVSEEGNFAHGKLEFVSAKYTDIDNVSYTFNSVEDYTSARFHGTGEIYDWRDGNKFYEEEDRRWAWGEARVPYGTELTVRVVPDEGYQLTSFSTSPNGFQATDTPGVYKITITKENFMNQTGDGFDLSPVFTQIGNEVKADSNKVSGGSISTSEQVQNGTLKLEVSDANVSGESRTEFENRATADGYTVDNYLDISLYNSIYKGGKKDANNNYLSWDTPIDSTENNASITLNLEDNMQGKDVAVIHEVHDGNQVVGYDLLNTTYNSNDNSITFETDSFSNYAIVSKGGSEAPVTHVVHFDTKGGTNIPDIEVDDHGLVTRPDQNPEKDGWVFTDWFEDEDCTRPFDFNTEIVAETTIHAGYIEEGQENPSGTQMYTVEDEGHNKVTFREETGHNYHLNIIDYLSFTKEEVMAAADITSAQYDQVFNGLKESVKKYGTMISLYEIRVTDENDHELDDNVPVTLRLKITPEMKGYDSFKLIYVKDDFTLGQVTNLTKQGDYLVANLPHLSVYTLVGEKSDSSSSSNAQTGDNIYIWMGTLAISVIGASSLVLLKRKKENN